MAQVLANYHLTIEVMTEYFESPTNVCDECLTELDAVFEAAVSGEYAFVVAGDDDFRLWFGDTEENAMAAGPIVSPTCKPPPCTRLCRLNVQRLWRVGKCERLDVTTSVEQVRRSATI